MIINYKAWQGLFLACAGIFLGSAFCMKWMEPDFSSGGTPFTVIGLEIVYPPEKMKLILEGLDPAVKMILRYHLHFDFVFMAGVYPGIAALCMMAAKKTTGSAVKKLLKTLALLQVLAWGCDIYENMRLLEWIREPGSIRAFGLYHFIVALKWVLALTGALVAIPLSLRRKKKD